tara:strand:+ start:123 stop:806 length:684 start_codon:yes stop_codon:yes gene_type:complete
MSAALELSKPVFDVGFFTSDIEPMLRFWGHEMGLSVEPAVAFNDGLTQYRHACGNSVVKINTASQPLAGTATGYRRLSLPWPGIEQVKEIEDPDGNQITLVPESSSQGPAIHIGVSDPERFDRFYTSAMGFLRLSEGVYQCGHSHVTIAVDNDAEPAGHWVDHGLRYFTVHVMRVDESYERVIDNGGTVGEAPYSIGEIARISFVRDPDGNWIEIAQRASLAGPWWD